MNDFAEKRDFQRMTLDSVLEYHVSGDDEVHQGQIKNLSATGVMFVCDRNVHPGAQVNIKLSPVNTITPPMSAEISVTRCDEHDEGGYLLAGEIIKIN